ncbi:uncharacterized protein LOC122394111 [Amphibalanus amphitrite]|uniref:uncharacterized protein LOC122364530 n=1 Tax=Amphibalanus amphitrite TaxID=1232801 RepID=UPI001C92A58C|nr:uncharacterized protein LOC122364530 [Amphibalanus amphitrite]XP_043192152.1 uncharacterized protein LOC122365214 [Amphibalanus amphitrite]XP_043195496.1 uncharacterized protein LOC122366904 [Amphibalanus amphitrite]XP_043204916.1 uncharacterized protein LOC122372107 [Amphibalanus amphitrite]XP_043215692.1 uncharacterized protein LOC122378552 [Amphibalanus amphitrite]XP_043215900.1 uncharacterized protein LOC122378661 [Amphibalanus amphitrite]XP_043219115.1 uncharacterized protein LOC12238
MPTSCAAYGCTSRSGKDKVSFYRFPKDNDRLNAWVRATRRKNFVPGAGARICSKHFITGAPVSEKGSPDWVPSVFNFPSSQHASNVGIGGVKRAERAQQRSAQKQHASLHLSASSGDQDEMCTAEEPVSQVSIEEARAAEALLEMSAATGTREVGCNTDGTWGENHKTVVSALLDRIHKLEAEVTSLKEECEQLLNSKKHNSFETLKENEEEFKFYTGFPSLAMFMWFVRVLCLGCDLSKISRLSVHNMVLMVLMKLRLGTTNQDLAWRFGVSRSLVSKIVQGTLSPMAAMCRRLIIWPSRESIQANLPLCFRYPELRKVRVVVDCFEIFTDRPRHLTSRKKMFSSYKHHNTCKVLIGVSPAGAITFLSPVWGGRSSDKKITLSSELIDILDPFDVVLADRGFTVSTEMALYNLKVLTPAFVRGQAQLPRAEVEKSRLLSRARIHVERVIGRMRTKFRILKSTLPVTMYTQVDDVVCVCAGIINLHPSVVP